MNNVVCCLAENLRLNYHVCIIDRCRLYLWMKIQQTLCHGTHSTIHTQQQRSCGFQTVYVYSKVDRVMNRLCRGHHFSSASLIGVLHNGRGLWVYDRGIFLNFNM